jgi:hypothetical protein
MRHTQVVIITETGLFPHIITAETSAGKRNVACVLFHDTYLLCALTTRKKRCPSVQHVYSQRVLCSSATLICLYGPSFFRLFFFNLIGVFKRFLYLRLV